MTIIVTVIGIIAFAIAGPIIGCFLAGLDRIISARMQGRVGPPLLQPALLQRERLGEHLRACLHPVRVHLHPGGGRCVLLWWKPAFERVPRDALLAALYRGRLFLALALL